MSTSGLASGHGFGFAQGWWWLGLRPLPRLCLRLRSGLSLRGFVWDLLPRPTAVRALPRLQASPSGAQDWRPTPAPHLFTPVAGLTHCVLPEPGSYWLQLGDAWDAAQQQPQQQHQQQQHQHHQQLHDHCPSSGLNTVTAVRLLQRPVLLAADLSALVGRRAHRGDDEACAALRRTWELSAQVLPLMLACCTSR